MSILGSSGTGFSGGAAGILNVIVTASTGQANAALRATSAEFKSTAAAAEASSSKTAAAAGVMGSRVAAIGKVVAGASVLVGAAAVKSSVDFKKSMTQIQTQAGASASEVKNLSSQVLDLAKKSVYGPNELATALYHVESVGYRGAKAMQVLNAAQKMATTGNSDLESTTYALVSATETGIKGTKNLSHAIGEMDAIVGRGDMRMEDFTAALSSGVLPAAKTWGLSLHDVGAALDTMTARGMPAQLSATRLRMTFSLLGHQSSTAAKALAGIGISQTTLAEAMSKGGPHGGLIAALQILHDHLIQAGDAAQQAQVISEAFGGGRTSAAIMTLLGNLDDVKKRYDGITQSTDQFGAHLKAAENTPANRLAKAWSNIQVMFVKLGSSILPPVVHLLTSVSDIITDPKLSGQEKFSKILDLLKNTFEKVAPTLAKAAAAAAGAFISGFWDAFQHSDTLGKLFTAAIFVRLIGGPGALGALGKWMGTSIGRTMGLSMATTAGEEVAATSGVFGAGGMLARGVKGIGSRLGASMGFALAAQLGGSMVGGRVGSAIQNIGTSAAAGFAVAGPWGAAAGAVVGTLITAFQKDTSGQDLAGKMAGVWGDAIQNGLIQAISGGGSKMKAAFKSLDQQLGDLGVGTFNKHLDSTNTRARGLMFESAKTGEERLKKLSAALKDEEQAARDMGNLQAANQIKALADQAHQASMTLGDLSKGFHFLSTGTGANMKDIMNVVRKNTKAIADTMGKNTADGRAAMAKNFHLAITNIQAAMDKGEINVKTGTRRIEHLMMSEDLIGATSKTAGAIGKVWASGMRNQSLVTKDNINQMLSQMQKMSDPAKKAAAASMLARLHVYKQEGAITNKQFDTIKSDVLSKFTDINVGAAKKADQLRLTMHRLAEELTGPPQQAAAAWKKAMSEISKELGMAAFFSAPKPPSGSGKKPGKYATGGIVPGIGNQDNVPVHVGWQHVANVKPGELVSVANPNATKALMQINSAVPAYADGGIINTLTGDEESLFDFDPAIDIDAGAIGSAFAEAVTKATPNTADTSGSSQPMIDYINDLVAGKVNPDVRTTDFWKSISQILPDYDVPNLVDTAQKAGVKIDLDDAAAGMADQITSTLSQQYEDLGQVLSDAVHATNIASQLIPLNGNMKKYQWLKEHLSQLPGGAQTALNLLDDLGFLRPAIQSGNTYTGWLDKELRDMLTLRNSAIQIQQDETDDSDQLVGWKGRGDDAARTWAGTVETEENKLNKIHDVVKGTWNKAQNKANKGEDTFRKYALVIEGAHAKNQMEGFGLNTVGSGVPNKGKFKGKRLYEMVVEPQAWGKIVKHVGGISHVASSSGLTTKDVKDLPGGSLPVHDNQKGFNYYPANKWLTHFHKQQQREQNYQRIGERLSLFNTGYDDPLWHSHAKDPIVKKMRAIHFWRYRLGLMEGDTNWNVGNQPPPWEGGWPKPTEGDNNTIGQILGQIGVLAGYTLPGEDSTYSGNSMLEIIRDLSGPAKNQRVKPLPDPSIPFINAYPLGSFGGSMFDREISLVNYRPEQKFDWSMFQDLTSTDTSDLVTAQQRLIEQLQRQRAVYTAQQPVFGYAKGGQPTGLSVVGEKGWELADFGSGGRVLSHDDSVDALKPHVEVTLNGDLVTGADSLEAAIDVKVNGKARADTSYARRAIGGSSIPKVPM